MRAKYAVLLIVLLPLTTAARAEPYGLTLTLKRALTGLESHSQVENGKKKVITTLYTSMGYLFDYHYCSVSVTGPKPLPSVFPSDIDSRALWTSGPKSYKYDLWLTGESHESSVMFLFDFDAGGKRMSGALFCTHSGNSPYEWTIDAIRKELGTDFTISGSSRVLKTSAVQTAKPAVDADALAKSVEAAPPVAQDRLRRPEPRGVREI